MAPASLSGDAEVREAPNHLCKQTIFDSRRRIQSSSVVGWILKLINSCESVYKTKAKSLVWLLEGRCYYNSGYFRCGEGTGTVPYLVKQVK